MKALELKNVSKIFGENQGIFDVCFSIEKGSFHALIGPNGAGKTTLIRTILNIYQEHTGEIYINNILNDDVNAFKGISYIGENARFPQEFSMEEYLVWAGLLGGQNKKQVKNKIYEISKRFKISDLLDKNPNKFSSGQKQKVMLAKILIENSNFIIMDEPTANLDPSARIVFFEEIKKINEEGKTVFICSHNLEEIEDKVTAVTVLKDGKIAYHGKKDNKTLSKIFREFAHHE